MDPSDRMIGDPFQHLAQIILGVEAVELCRFGQRIDRGGPPATGVRSCEQPVVDGGLNPRLSGAGCRPGRLLMLALAGRGASNGLPMLS